MANHRLEYIDVAKGIGIILVILGHLLTYGSPASCVIYSFHMPFFFFVSGVFDKPDSIKFSKYIYKNFKRLLWPYFIFFFIGIFLPLIIPFWEFSSIGSLVNQFIYASPEGIYVGQIWFLACLFDVTILFFPLYKLVLARNNILLNFLSIICIAWFAGFLLPILRAKFNLPVPFKIESAVMALVFYSAGFLLKKHIIINKQNGDIIILLVGIPVIIFLPYKLNKFTNLGTMTYNNLFYYLFFSFVGTITLLILSRYIEQLKMNIFNCLKFIGKNSLFIFALHSIPLYIYTWILSLIHEKEIINGKNVSYFESIIGCIIITVIMIIFTQIYLLIKRKLINKVSIIGNKRSG